jgi:hypothetical protein
MGWDGVELLDERAMGDEFREDGGERQVGGIVVVAEQDDYSISRTSAQQLGLMPLFTSVLIAIMGTYRHRGPHGTLEPWISEFSFNTFMSHVI